MFLELLALILIVAFSGYRIARAITQDKITEEFRKKLFSWTYEVPDRVADQKFEEAETNDHVKPPTRPKKSHQYVYNLLTCPLCVGFWITLAIGLVASTQYTDGSVFHHLLVAIAATGVQAFLSLREMAR